MHADHGTTYEEFFSYEVVATFLVNPYFKREFRLEFPSLLSANEVDVYPGTKIRSKGKKAIIRVK